MHLQEAAVSAENVAARAHCHTKAENGGAERRCTKCLLPQNRFDAPREAKEHPGAPTLPRDDPIAELPHCRHTRSLEVAIPTAAQRDERSLSTMKSRKQAFQRPNT